ncbi:hypothetical protein B0H19DRAFT_425775 [Mycena capillaripes]|nr:hypothetical protein B0H19DRAFT_425775 [Mycena capillaripes]
MDFSLNAILKSNEPLDAHQALVVRSRLARSLNELSILEDTLLKVSLVAAEIQRQRDRCLESITGMRGALSPIRVIPPEILAAIFLMCRAATKISRLPNIPSWIRPRHL